MADKKDEGPSLTEEADQKEAVQKNIKIAEDFLKGSGVFSTPKSSDKALGDKSNDDKSDSSEGTK